MIGLSATWQCDLSQAPRKEMFQASGGLLMSCACALCLFHFHFRFEKLQFCFLHLFLDSFLSSPRAESARAFTGRRNSHSGRGEDFLTGQPIFFTETAVTPERKVEKWFPRWEINRHTEG